jgi:hypothetical protein
MSTVLPPAPFPPLVDESPDVVDLAVRLRRAFFTRSWLGGPARESLEQRLALAVDGARWERAAVMLRALLDCWPLAASVDDAWQAWRGQRSPLALAQLARVAEILRLAQGWDALPLGPWCSPDATWIRAQVGAGATRVRRRCVADGGARVCRALGLPLEPEPALPPGLARQASASLPEHRAALARDLAAGDLRAVWVQGPPPEDPAGRLALGELRLEGSHQRALERFGLAGLELAPDGPLPAWHRSLSPPSPGVAGPVLKAVASGRFLPGPEGALVAGQPQRVGYLLWSGPHAPVPVAPVAVAVLQALDGSADAAALAERLGGPVEQVGLVLDDLVRLGAASALGV